MNDGKVKSAHDLRDAAMNPWTMLVLTPSLVEP